MTGREAGFVASEFFQPRRVLRASNLGVPQGIFREKSRRANPEFRRPFASPVSALKIRSGNNHRHEPGTETRSCSAPRQAKVQIRRRDQRAIRTYEHTRYRSCFPLRETVVANRCTRETNDGSASPRVPCGPGPSPANLLVVFPRGNLEIVQNARPGETEPIGASATITKPPSRCRTNCFHESSRRSRGSDIAAAARSARIGNESANLRFHAATSQYFAIELQ